METPDVLDHRPPSKRTRIAAPEQNPRIVHIRLHVVSPGHRQFHVVGKVVEIVDGLLDGVDAEALDAEVGVRVRGAVESVLEDDGGAVLLLGDLAVDCSVG